MVQEGTVITLQQLVEEAVQAIGKRPDEIAVVFDAADSYKNPTPERQKCFWIIFTDDTVLKMDIVTPEELTPLMSQHEAPEQLQ